MSRCNYCLLQDLRRYAARTNQSVTMRPARRPPASPLLGRGVDVFVHPPDASPEEYFAAWLAALPEHCVC